jgi:hypothetical protein
MRRFRFSIASLLGLVLFVAVGIAALRASTDAWDSGVFGATLLALLVAVLLTVHRTGERRAYWLGLSLFGWAYLVASLVPPVESRLPTTKGLVYLGGQVANRRTIWAVGPVRGRANAVRTVDLAPDGTLTAPGWPGAVRIWNRRGGLNYAPEEFVAIGHSLTALIMAFAGGFLSRHLKFGAGSSESDRSARGE